MEQQSLNLLYTDNVTFNDNKVEELQLNGETLWKTPSTHISNVDSMSFNFTTGTHDYEGRSKVTPSLLRKGNKCGIYLSVTTTDSGKITKSIELGGGATFGSNVTVNLTNLRVDSSGYWGVTISARVSGFFSVRASVVQIYSKYPTVKS